MKLLVEHNLVGASIQAESTDGQKKMFIEGPFLMFDKKNRNGRVYPKNVMKNAVKEYTEEYVKTSRALGEMNHPAGRLTADPERACILTTDLHEDGPNHFYGKAKVLSTPLGKVLQALLEDGVKMGVSSRGLASVRKDGTTTVVQPDFRLTVAADCVWDPSVGDAFVQHLMEEKEYLLIDGSYVERDLFEEKARILKAPAGILQETKLMAFQNFLSKIK